MLPAGGLVQGQKLGPVQDVVALSGPAPGLAGGHGGGQSGGVGGTGGTGSAGGAGGVTVCRTARLQDCDRSGLRL